MKFSQSFYHLESRDMSLRSFITRQQISKFYPQIQRTDASSRTYVSQWPVINIKASFYAYNLLIRFLYLLF